MHEEPLRQLGLQVESLFPPGPQLQGWRNGFQRHSETILGYPVEEWIDPPTFPIKFGPVRIPLDVKIDPAMEPGTVEFTGPNGETLGKITNIRAVFDRGEDPDVIFDDGLLAKKSEDLGAILDPNSIRIHTEATEAEALTLETLSELIDKLEASLPPRMEIRIAKGQMAFKAALISTRLVDLSERTALGSPAVPNLAGIPIVEHDYIPAGSGSVTEFERFCPTCHWNPGPHKHKYQEIPHVRFILLWRDGELKCYSLPK